MCHVRVHGQGWLGVVSGVCSRLPICCLERQVLIDIMLFTELLAPVPYMTPEGGGGDDEPLLVEPNSLLGQFLRRCILSFNLLSFEVMLLCSLTMLRLYVFGHYILCLLLLFIRISIPNIALNVYLDILWCHLLYSGNLQAGD